MVGPTELRKREHEKNGRKLGRGRGGGDCNHLSPFLFLFIPPAPIFARPTLSRLPHYLRAWNRLRTEPRVVGSTTKVTSNVISQLNQWWWWWWCREMKAVFLPRLYFYMIILGATTMQYLVIKYFLFLPGMADKWYRLHSRDPEDVLCDQSYSVHTNTFHLVVVRY